MATESLQWMDSYEQVRSVVAPMLENLARRVESNGIAVQTQISRGTAYLEIEREARRMKADLIVIGTHGRTGLQRWILGSVAERVVRMAPCPVLTVRS